ncbi:hypothetical protein N310_00202, partial [Acanthisitta chloris]
VTVIGIVAFLTTLIAPVVGVEGAPGRRPVVTGATRHPSGHFHSDPGATCMHILPVEAKHSILRIPGVLKLHEGKPRRVPGDPHGSQRAVVAEGSLQFAFAGARAQVAHV